MVLIKYRLHTYRYTKINFLYMNLCSVLSRKKVAFVLEGAILCCIMQLSLKQL